MCFDFLHDFRQDCVIVPRSAFVKAHNKLSIPTHFVNDVAFESKKTFERHSSLVQGNVQGNSSLFCFLVATSSPTAAAAAGAGSATAGATEAAEAGLFIRATLDAKDEALTFGEISEAGRLATAINGCVILSH